ncbi:glycogen/starch/alpha-glucan phosphorylase [Alkalihalobacillus sp. MEB130]|uniref:glycogen/starch/alpha-glucan phosphorylase n=1 Tax=Alkalihalobacillus sp. MEB130 TaxID=2976704 RepID=UPI0028DE5E55|nr:glycogen/starch/alpha-glucan phosphorylase [Alkalihalobacillus sp. MEB130]MDT8862070.1 glycogen/starch/alpha-glucan phosphorylase [Alkalihalobacillus sp. MEB130]
MSITVENLSQLLKEKLTSSFGKSIEETTTKEMFQSICLIMKDSIHPNWQMTQKTYENNESKQVYYFSMEFLLGRMIETNLLNLGLLDVYKETLTSLGFNPEEVFREEHDAGLGNGGLGRLAACFLDSLASLQLPGHGMGIRYKYGLFQQKVVNGYQVELPDYWLEDEYMWETKRNDKAIEVRFGGTVETTNINGELHFQHHDYERVLAIPYDVPIVGYDNHTVNTLRLWSAESTTNHFHFHSSRGHDYYHYLDYKRSIEKISEFLYPDDSFYEGKILRLKQQYFLVSAGLQSILRSYKKKNKPLHELSKYVVIQINDTHPSLVVPELMRLLLDEEKLGWDEAWAITQETVAYTNHTTLSEALEKWPEDMIQTLFPRLYQIIHEINERFCKMLWFDYPELRDQIHEMAILSYGQIHMAHLAMVGSFSINGVAKLHTSIIKDRVMKPFHHVFPDRFNNKTNGITHRRWLLNANPGLAEVITDAIGSDWIKKPELLQDLLPFSTDPAFQDAVAKVKHDNKKKLASYIQQHYNVTIDDQSIVDVHIKRLHGYKRQLLNLFHIIHLYNVCLENPNLEMTPRTFIFGAKAAPGYTFAKQVIKLINAVAEKINHHPTVSKHLKVLFLENYQVTLAELIIPAADVSEQISTASKEASGTGNMKLMMNGALTIGTQDGANVEIGDYVGPDNIFTFGLTSEEVFNYQIRGDYRARDYYNNDRRLRTVMDHLVNQHFSGDDVEFKDIFYSLLYNNDEYFVLRDFDSYLTTQQKVDRTYQNQREWLQKSVINIGHSGVFSSDRTIKQYADDIWNIHPTLVPSHPIL